MHLRTAALLGTLVLLQLVPLQVPAESLSPVHKLIQSNRVALQAKVQKSGGTLEIYRNQRVRLLVDQGGRLLFRKAKEPASRVRPVRMWGWFQRRNLPGLTVEQLGQRLTGLLKKGPSKTSGSSECSGSPKAILPNGRKVAPDHFGGGYYGSCVVDPQRAVRTGFPRRGNDWRLREHSEEEPNSAFRGTTTVVSDPVTGNGAAYWAGKGGWVFEIRGVPSWNVNSQLAGRVLRGLRYGGNLMHGENETAIPANVPPERIKAYGQVVEDGRGRLFVRQWIPNPKYKE